MSQHARLRRSEFPLEAGSASVGYGDGGPAGEGVGVPRSKGTPLGAIRLRRVPMDSRGVAPNFGASAEFDPRMGGVPAATALRRAEVTQLPGDISAADHWHDERYFVEVRGIDYGPLMLHQLIEMIERGELAGPQIVRTAKGDEMLCADHPVLRQHLERVHIRDTAEAVFGTPMQPRWVAPPPKHRINWATCGWILLSLALYAAIAWVVWQRATATF